MNQATQEETGEGLKRKRLGIVGGLGPETSCKFCLKINDKVREITGCQPDIVMENLPVPLEVEQKAIKGGVAEEMRSLLFKAVERLNKSEADFLVIPCNTVHVFIEELRARSEKPVLSIIEETAEECLGRGLKKVGLIASTKTVRERLHEKRLKERGICLVLPEREEQERISRVIIKIIHNKTDEEDKRFLLRIVEKMNQKGAEAVILGCTDLGLLVSKGDCCLPVIDTLLVLEEKVVKEMVC